MKEVIARINGFQREGHRPVIMIERELIRCHECRCWTWQSGGWGTCDVWDGATTRELGYCHEGRTFEEPTMEEFMQGQDLGDPEDGSL